MATWANLTQEQRDIYQAFERQLRAAHGTFHQLLATFVELDNAYIAQIQAILTALDDNTLVPNSSGLAGAAALDSDSEMVALVTELQTALTNHNTTADKQLRNKAAGINATL